MHFVRLQFEGRSLFARLQDTEEDLAHVLSTAPWAADVVDTGEVVPWKGHLLAPVVPSKIVAVGRNYAAHAKELGNTVPDEPLLFLKAPSSIIGPNDTIQLPHQSQRVEHEAELAIVVGKRAKNVTVGAASSHIFGFTCLGDITARDLQRKDVQFTRAKSFDSFCPVGPWIVTGLDVTRDSGLHIGATVNGLVRQAGHTRDMVFSVAQIVSYISQMMTLEAGDLIATGTPEGVGPLVAGDVLAITIENVGTLTNPVR